MGTCLPTVYKLIKIGQAVKEAMTHKHRAAGAADENDCAYVYENEPKIDGTSYWCSSGASNFEVNGLVSYLRGTCDWKESLVKRPEVQ